MKRNVTKDREIVAAALGYARENQDKFILSMCYLDAEYTESVLYDLWRIHVTSHENELIEDQPTLVEDQPVTVMPEKCCVFGCGGTLVECGGFMVCRNCGTSMGRRA